MDFLENLKSEFNHHVSFREKRPGIVQVLAPLFHEDGDMVDIFLDLPKSSNEEIRISDHGMTLMRLSYSYDVDTPTKRRILSRILSENGMDEDGGRLYLNTSKEQLYPSLLQFAQAVAKVSNMQAFKREVMQNLFFEMLGDFVKSSLSRFMPLEHYLPMPSRDDLEVDWKLSLPRDVFLFGVRDGSKARLAALSCREFQMKGVAFRSVIVHEDFENGLSKKDQSRITNAADKQFTSLADFQANAEGYFQRELQTVQ
ncbi:DUF1828 domain-containing protein [Telmatobacter bradus]|uniref:DUF1828 domain-containing protein n=1 Tax=Telmatobacter bradus TaxID=474953 RepID=UPI003B42E14A